MTSQHKAGFGTFFRAAGAALQWRLMLLWLIALLVPTAIATYPVSAALGPQLDNSLLAAGLATGFDTAAFTDVMMSLSDVQPALMAAIFTGLVLTLLLGPLMTCMVSTAIRSGRKPGFAELLQGGVVEYGRQFRVLLIGGIVVILAATAGMGLMGLVGKGAAKAIVETELDTKAMWASIAAVVMFAIAMAVLDAARAQFAADSTLRSAFRAYGRGLKQLLRRPIATLGLFVLITVIGLALAALFGVWRISAGSVLVGFLLAQLIALSTAWMRTARLYALTEVATSR
jgi:hypothetical protein